MIPAPGSSDYGNRLYLGVPYLFSPLRGNWAGGVDPALIRFVCTANRYGAVGSALSYYILAMLGISDAGWPYK